MTLLFWLVVTGLVLGVLLLIVPPLLRRADLMPTPSDDRSRVLYQHQFAELDEDRRSGLLSEDQHRVAREELARRILEDTRPAPAQTPGDPASVLRHRLLARRLAVGLGGLIPVASVALYWTLGAPLALTQPAVPATPQANATEDAHQAAGGLDALADRLKTRLERTPEDEEGWALLARSYVELDRHAEAVPVFQRAVKLLPDDAQLLADYADALGMLHGRSLDGQPETLINRALKLDPRNVKALMLAGTIAFDRKEYGRAVTLWSRARAAMPADADPAFVQEVAANIREAESLRGGGGAIVMPVSERRHAITGTVRVTPDLMGKVARTDTLFVFAKPVNGPSMPVAIVQATGGALPFTFWLDDTTSVMPARKLSQSGPVRIVARLSRSGEATPRRGDLEGRSGTVHPGTDAVHVVIDRVIASPEMP